MTYSGGKVIDAKDDQAEEIRDFREFRRPQPLVSEGKAPEEYPVEALGPLGEVGKALIQGVQAPDGICCHTVLASASLAVQSHLDVVNDGRVHPTSLYLMSIAESGERKSAADKVALVPHKIRERERREEYGPALKRYKDKNKVWEALRREALKKPKSMDDGMKGLGALVQPVPPPNYVTVHGDVTVEGLIKNYQGGHPSQGLFTPEGGRLFGGYGMSDGEQLKTAATLSEFWDGSDIARSRSGEGTWSINGPRLSAHIMIQPVVMPKVFNPTLLNQAFLPRFLISYPTSLAGSRTYLQEDVLANEHVIAFHARLLDILRRPFPLGPGNDAGLDPRKIGMSPEAKRLWVAFYENVEKQMRSTYANMRGFASKAAEHVLRIAGVLAGYENLDLAYLGLEHIERAIMLVEFYLDEYSRIIDVAGESHEILAARRVLK